MATRRFRIKAVANVSVARGRCVEKSSENEKLFEETSSNSSTSSDPHDVSPSETKLAENVSDNTLVGEPSGDSSSNDTLENSSGHHLVQISENVSEPTCMEASGSDRPTPVDTPSVVSCDLVQHTGDTVVQHSGKCVTRTNEGILGATSEQCFKSEESIESVRSGDSCVKSAQKIDTTENKTPSASIRLPRKRMKPAVSLSLVNRKVKENSALKVTQECSSLNESLENSVTQNSGSVREPSALEAHDNDRSTPVDTASAVDYHLLQHPASADVQQSDGFDTKDEPLSNRTVEDVTSSTGEDCSKTEESIDSVISEESYATSSQEIEPTETKGPAATIRLHRKRVKPAVSLSLLNKREKEHVTVENSPVCHSVHNSLNDKEPMCLEENGSFPSAPVDESVINCNLTQDPGYADIQQSNNCDNKDESLCNRTTVDITASTVEDCSKSEESINSVRSEESCATSTQKTDTTETKVLAAPIRLPRKRVKPAVSLSLLNKKVKENLTVENNPICQSVQNSSNVSEPSCLEENGSGCSNPVDASVINCDLTQNLGYAETQQSDNCDSKDVSLCNRTTKDVTASTAEHCTESKESVVSVRLEDSCAASGQEIDLSESKVPAAPVRLPRKRVKAAVSLSLVKQKVKDNLTVENNPVCHSVQNSLNDKEPTCLEENGSVQSVPVDSSVINCNLTQDPGYADIQQDFTASTGEHCSKTEESIDSVTSEESYATSGQKIDTTETKVHAPAIRLPRKRVKPAVSLSLVNKVRENLRVENNNSVSYSVQNSSDDSEPTRLEENGSGRSTPVGASVINCDVTQDTGYADIQQSDNCDSKDVSICNRTKDDITASSAEHNSKTEKSVDSVTPDESCATSSQKIDTTETKVPAPAIRLPRKRVKPAVSLSLVNKVRENLTVENNNSVSYSVQNSSDDSEPTCLEENGSGRSTPVGATVINCDVTQDTGYADIQQSDNCDSKDVSLCDRTKEYITASTGEHNSKTEESIHSVRSEDPCATSSQKIDTTEIKISAAPVKLPRKRMKPTVSLSSVNKKLKESDAVGLTQQCGASRIDEDSSGQVTIKVKTSESSSDLHKGVEAGFSVRTSPAVGNGTPCTNELQEVQKKNGSDIVPQSYVESHVLQTTVCESERRNENSRDLISVDTPVGELDVSAVTVNTHTCDSHVTSESPVVENDERTSPPVKCSVNQSVKDCSQLNSFRSRFVRPKPLLESAARRNRTSSIGSASESDSEKKSLSSTTTVSPQWKPKLKTSRTTLTHVHTMESDKLANASSASTDESEDERSSISRAATISPPKRITRLESYAGSDTSHSDFYQEVSEEISSPVKKSTTPEWKTRRKEYLRRIIEIKKEISHKVSDGRVNKSRLTMFDLIYYNPVTNPMKSAQEPDGRKSAPVPTPPSENENRLVEESVDEPKALEDEEQSSSVPVPQVKVGPNGEIILDEQSLVIETTDAQKNWNDLQNSEVIMDYGNGSTTFNAYSKKRRTRTKDWSREETLRFYRALHTVGTDFLVMQSLFPKFTRKELKDRYKKEERINRALVEKALRNPLTFDLTQLQKEFELERLEEEKRLTLPKKPRRKEGFSRSCSLFATLDSTDEGNREKPAKGKRRNVKNIDKTLGQKKRITDDTTADSECKPGREETHSEKKRKTDDAKTPDCTGNREETRSKKKRKTDDTKTPSEHKANKEETRSKKKRKIADTTTPSECTDKGKETHSKKKRKTDDTGTLSECTDNRKEIHSKKKRKIADTTPSECTDEGKESHSKKKRKTDDTITPSDSTLDSEATESKEKRKADDARAGHEHLPDNDASNALNGHVDSEHNVPEAVSQIKPTRSGRIPRPRIFEDFMTDDDIEEIYEETEITEICERVTVEDICNPQPLGDESTGSEIVVDDEDTRATYESDNDDQNFVIAEDALTVQQSQVNLGNVYSNVKPGTLIVLATESPDNPGHQIFRVFMVSNNSQTLPVSVANNQASPAGTPNTVEMNTSTNPVVSESSTNDCNSLRKSAESSS